MTAAARRKLDKFQAELNSVPRPRKSFDEEFEIFLMLKQDDIPETYHAPDEWDWLGAPYFMSNNKSVPRAVELALLRIICQSSTADCAKSSSSYVREAKLWLTYRLEETFSDLYTLHKENRA